MLPNPNLPRFCGGSADMTGTPLDLGAVRARGMVAAKRPIGASCDTGYRWLAGPVPLG